MTNLRDTLKSAVEESKKKTKSEVHYREGTPSRHCGICSMFVKPDKCTDVKGKIESDDLCDIFDRRKK